MAIIEPNSSSALYKGLSSYWIKAFKDSAQLEAMYSGTETLFAQLYLDLMEIILSKSLTNIPVYHKEDWRLLLLQDNLLDFEPAVASHDTQEVNSITISARADTAIANLDNTYIAFTDVHGRRTQDRELFPTYGVYNNFEVGKSTDPKVWTVVVPSNTTIAEAIALVKSRVISNRKIEVIDTGAAAEIVLLQNETIAQTVTITSAEQAALVDAEDLATLINSKLTLHNVVATIQAKYLIITSEGSTLRATYSNSAFQQLTSVLPFNFIIDMKVPSLISESKVWDIGYYVQLLTVDYAQGGSEYRFQLQKVNGKYPKKVSFLSNTLYAPSVILEEGVDYRVNNGHIYFVSNPFELTNVAYRVIDGQKQLAFWMSDLAYDNSLLYERYGYRYTEPQDASLEYKNFLRGMMFYFTDGPILENIKSAMDLVAGIPVALENGEIVLQVAPTSVTTDKNIYNLPVGVNPIVVVGQELHAFESISDAFVVEDYVTNPSWYKDSFIPKALMPLETPEFRIAREHTFVPVVGEQGFIVGDLDPSSYKLITNPITPYGNWYIKYKLPSDAYFAIEFKDTGLSTRVLLPVEYTADAYALEDVAVAINKALLQVENTPYTNTTLDYDATFEINGSNILVPEGTYVNFTAIITNINTQLPTGIRLVRSENPSTTTFLSDLGEPISISNVSAVATSILGIQGATSLQGIYVTAVGNTLEFQNVSSNTAAYLKIYDMNATAKSLLGMEAFMPGSGHLIGDDGQGSISYKIFDELLKYNTFKVSFSLGTFSMDGDLHSLAQIVLEGRPTYTAPVITPYYEFLDEYSSEDNITEQEVTQYTDLILSTDPAVRVQYDTEYKQAEFAVLDRVDTKIHLNSGQSNVRFRSKDTQVFDRFKHHVRIGIENHLLPEETHKYFSVGVHNVGLGNAGEKYPLHYMDPVNSGAHMVGVYTADFSLVTGPYLTELDGRADTMFIMDKTRPDSIQDLGFSVGDFLVLHSWPDAGNNGEFSITNVSYNVSFNGGLVDIVWYQNPDHVVDNFLGSKDLIDESMYGYRYMSGNTGKDWFITLPDTSGSKLQIQILNEAVGDNKEQFPFNITYEGETTAWPYTATYYDFYIDQEPKEPYSFVGERFQVSRLGGDTWDVGDGDVILGQSGDYVVSPEDYTYELGFHIGHTTELIGGNIIIGPPEDYAGGEFSTLEDFAIEGTLAQEDSMQLTSEIPNCTKIGAVEAIIGAPGYEVCAGVDVGGVISGETTCYAIGSPEAVIGDEDYLVCTPGVGAACYEIGSPEAVIGAGGYFVCTPGGAEPYCYLAKYPGGDPLTYPVGNYAIICHGTFVPTPIPGYIEYVA